MAEYMDALMIMFGMIFCLGIYMICYGLFHKQWGS